VEAASWFEQALREKSSQAGEEQEAYWRLAWLLAQGPADLRDVRRAVELAEQATRLKADDPDALRALGGALYRAGQDEQRAVAALEQSLAVGGGQREGLTLYLLALARHRSGAAGPAAEAAERGRDWHPRNAATLTPDERFDLRALRGEVDAVVGKAKPPAKGGAKDDL
jgi:tetratricopeptide (TPR) repeat protein